MKLHSIGIDLGKTVFRLVGLSPSGDVIVRKKFSWMRLLRFTANLEVELIGMEACGGAHFPGRALREQGHEVRLIPAQYVKPFVKTRVISSTPTGIPLDSGLICPNSAPSVQKHARAQLVR